MGMSPVILGAQRFILVRMRGTSGRCWGLSEPATDRHRV